jgi:hypothetical protein
MDLREISCEGVDWIQRIQDRNKWRDHVKTVMEYRVP